MAKVYPIQKDSNEEGYEAEHVEPLSMCDTSSPEDVMFRMQGPLRLDAPLAHDGGASSGKQAPMPTSVQNKKQAR